MNGLREKFRNKKGFTLIEMLIVVAIIAILIAISIPLVGQALERAREATDAANERSFKAELVICYLAGTDDGKELATGGGNKFLADGKQVYSYDAANGKLLKGEVDGKYGKGTANAGQDKVARDGQYLKATVDADGTVHMQWSASAGLTSDALNGTTTTTPEEPEKP